jgi:hypothetical protein
MTASVFKADLFRASMDGFEPVFRTLNLRKGSLSSSNVNSMLGYWSCSAYCLPGMHYARVYVPWFRLGFAKWPFIIAPIVQHDARGIDANTGCSAGSGTANKMGWTAKSSNSIFETWSKLLDAAQWQYVGHNRMDDHLSRRGDSLNPQAEAWVLP